MMDHVVLMVPGLGNSDKDHWQSVWESRSPKIKRVQQGNWDEPDLDLWLKSLSSQIVGIEKPEFIAAHRIGSALVAHWAVRQASTHAVYYSRVFGVLLISSADVEAPDRIPPQVRYFAPMVFPSIVLASDDDPYVAEERTRFFAKCWGGRNPFCWLARPYFYGLWSWRMAAGRENFERIYFSPNGSGLCTWGYRHQVNQNNV